MIYTNINTIFILTNYNITKIYLTGRLPWPLYRVLGCLNYVVTTLIISVFFHVSMLLFLINNKYLDTFWYKIIMYIIYYAYTFFTLVNGIQTRLMITHLLFFPRCQYRFVRIRIDSHPDPGGSTKMSGTIHHQLIVFVYVRPALLESISKIILNCIGILYNLLWMVRLSFAT